MNSKIQISIIIIWVFTISGIIGIISPAKNWFLSITPLNLLINFLLILFHLENINIKTFLVLSFPLLLGFITEALGVNYGVFFGQYSYGDNLGVKIMGVPIIICINWTMLTLLTSDLSKKISSKLWQSVILGALFMTLLDVLLEISAPRFDFWEFKGGKVPIQNYICWFIIALITQTVHQSMEIKTSKIISSHLLASIFFFFSIFLFV